MTQTTPRLQLTGIQKAFGATQALGGVDLTVEAGEVHAIIGENGAGKSTLMKVLSGAHQPDDGELKIDGRVVSLWGPRDSQAAGIAMIYQELNLASDLSVAENITLGCEPLQAGIRGKLGIVDAAAQRSIARAALEKLHCSDIPLDRPTGELSIAQQQMVEIARAVAGSTSLKLLILDEPTSSLTQVDTENLFAVVNRLREEGVSVLYISHFLEECQAIADRFTVLRDGVSVGCGRMASGTDAKPTYETDDSPVPMDEIIRMMVGREMSELYPRFAHEPGEVLLTINDLSGRNDLPSHVSLQIRRGEILGIAGLIGAGRTETLRSLFGLNAIESGAFEVFGRSSPSRAPVSSWTRDRMGLVSEDRKNEGLLLNQSLTDNLTLTKTKPYEKFGLLNDRRMREATESWMDALDVKANHADQTIGELSGGNQQKIAFGRLLHHDCEILLLDEPTRGIDIGSKRTIYQAIGKLAADGKAVLLVSSYLPELLGVCDRIAVMSRGEMVDIRPTDQWDEHSLLAAAIGS